MNLFKSKKKKELEILKDYYERVKHHPYKEPKKHLVRILQWLISYYEGKTASTPKVYLEALIDLDTPPISQRQYQEEIRLLYNWVYYKKVIGF